MVLFDGGIAREDPNQPADRGGVGLFSLVAVEVSLQPFVCWDVWTLGRHDAYFCL